MLYNSVYCESSTVKSLYFSFSLSNNSSIYLIISGSKVCELSSLLLYHTFIEGNTYNLTLSNTLLTVSCLKPESKLLPEIFCFFAIAFI